MNRKCLMVGLIALGIQACGVKISDDFVMGTTSYLQEVNAGKNRGIEVEGLGAMDSHTPEEQQELAGIINNRRFK
jgi:hypothetical protein